MNGLPKKLKVNGISYRIRTDYRDILKIIQALNDTGLTGQEKCYICLKIIYYDFEGIPVTDYEEAYRQAAWFIDCGNRYTEKKTEQVRMMDWEHDESVLIPAINRVAGKEVRSVKYIHWWSFIGFYMEIGECVFSEVIYIRQKLRKKQKLEKYERDFYRDNKELIELPVIKTKEDEEEDRIIESIFG